MLLLLLLLEAGAQSWMTSWSGVGATPLEQSGDCAVATKCHRRLNLRPVARTAHANACECRRRQRREETEEEPVHRTLQHVIETFFYSAIDLKLKN